MHKNHPAFPVRDEPDIFHGMDHRTYIATAIMASIMGQRDIAWAKEHDMQCAAMAAVIAADFLIEELSA